MHLYCSAQLNLLYACASSAEKEKVTQERKGLAPGRGSLSEPSGTSISIKKHAPSPAPPALPGVEITDGSVNNISTTNSTDTVHSDGKSAL